MKCFLKPLCFFRGTTNSHEGTTPLVSFFFLAGSQEKKYMFGQEDDGVDKVADTVADDEAPQVRSHMPPVRAFALRLMRANKEPKGIQYTSMDGHTIPLLTFEQVQELERTLALQHTQRLHPAYLCEMMPETSRFFLDLDLKHKGELPNQWLLELCSFLNWQIGQIHPHKVFVVVLLSGCEIVTEVVKGKVHRRPKQKQTKRLEKSFATLLKVNAALMAPGPNADGAQGVQGSQSTEGPGDREANCEAGREAGREAGCEANREEDPEANATRKTGVHLYTNTCIPAAQFAHLIDFLASSAAQHFGERPKGVCLAENLSECFDKPSSLRVPLCNKMGKCAHCTGKKPQSCPACLGRGMTDHGKPYGVAWVLSSERGAVAHENEVRAQLQNPVNLLAATRLRVYPEATDVIGTHQASLSVPASMLKVDCKGLVPRACGQGVPLDVATLKPFIDVMRTVHKQWAEMKPTAATIMTATQSGVKFVNIKFGGFKFGVNVSNPSNFYCPTKGGHHKTLTLFLRWTFKKVRTACMHPRCSHKGPQEVKVSTADSEKLSLLFTLLVRPKELQLNQAKVPTTHLQGHEQDKVKGPTLSGNFSVLVSKESKKRTCEDTKLRAQDGATSHALSDNPSFGLPVKPAKKKNRTEMM